jgi:RNA polymerase sporulation-specific sigma factor
MFFLTILSHLFALTGSYSIDAFLEPLSKEEEEKCILDKDTNPESRNKLIEHNLRLVAHIVKKYDKKEGDMDDLISIGTIGLIKGIDTYQMNRQVRITTYCARCIENEILMYFRANKKNNNNISLDDPIGFDKEGNEITILDIVKSPKPDYLEDIDTKDNIKLLTKYLNTLNNREKEIVVRRYGLNNHDEQTQKEIAKDLKISRSYVSRIEKRAITKILREFIKLNKDKKN